MAAMSLVSSIENFFRSIGHDVEKVFSPQLQAEIAGFVSKAMPDAIAAAQYVATAAPNQTSTEIAKLLTDLNVPYTNPELTSGGAISAQEADGYLLQAARAALQNKLATNWPTLFKDGLEIGAQAITAVTGVPLPLLDLAVQTAYTFITGSASKTAAPAAA